MDEQQLAKPRTLYAMLSDKEYIQLRVEVAKKGMKLGTWVTQVIQEKLNVIKEEQ